ncbi:LacI family DNA-binding transcriptional regulator [Ruegeria atlantica]|uniref:HTH-type transcriptional repressor CytR n=1 Tax=Ruegeria atlantica TaxID=81569 RepID=A0A0P1EXS7_9RHOB|nr:LacI family DNA-binding transcriptional regulator [Ruegeria atlantica]CUH46605.1 HTH-type transcriptional repressor CytR [Ruegeria atlantica]
MAKKPATVQDVAKAAQVSTATVSRALRKPELLTENTKKAVFEAIKSTGYRVNRAARNLRTRRAGAILVLVPNLAKPFFSAVLSGINDGFAESGLEVLITDSEGKPILEGDLAGRFLDGSIDGVISLDGSLSKSVLDHCRAANVAEKIVFACEWTSDPFFPSIRSDNVKGARLAIRHLHQMGHRNIAHVTGPEGNVLTGARRSGMHEERERLNLPSRPEWIIRGDFSLESGHAAASQILAMQERPSAVFCAADMVAFGLISGLRQGGVSVPQDISVVGFDDIEMSEFYVPALTTIRQDRHEIGMQAAERLLRRLSGHSDDNDFVAVDVELIVRDSVLPLSSAH